MDDNNISNIPFIRVPEREEKDRAEKALKEIITENSPILAKDIQIAEQTPNRIKQKKSTARHNTSQISEN